jgi:hypothetical protein
MKKALLAIAAIGLIGFSVPAMARSLGEAGEAEAARMHAKAGGPTNYRDAELLERYGCRDKHDSEYCMYLYHKQNRHFRYKRYGRY